MVRYVIFDFDGTIADSRYLAFDVYNEHAKTFDFRQIKKEELPMLRNMSTVQRLRFMGAALWKLPKILFSAMTAYRNRLDEIQDYAGVEPLLRELQQLGYHLQILSSNTEENINGYLTQHRLDMFEAVYHASFLKGKAKTLREFISDKNIHVEQVLYIGDEVRDIEACRKVGVMICSVTWGFDSTEALASHQPDWIVHSPQELKRVIENWYSGGKA